MAGTVIYRYSAPIEHTGDSEIEILLLGGRLRLPVLGSDKIVDGSTAVIRIEILTKEKASG